MWRAREEHHRADSAAADKLLNELEAERWACLLVRVKVMGLVDNSQIPRFSRQHALVPPIAVKPQGV